MIPISQQCTAIKKNGKRCGQRALPDRETCVQHTPRDAVRVDEITLLKAKLLRLMKSKNDRVAANAALTLGRLLARFPPERPKTAAFDLRRWTPDERSRLRAILDQMKDLRKQVAERLDPPPVVAEATSTEPPIASAPVQPEPIEPVPAESPDDQVEVLGSRGLRLVYRRDLSDETLA
jgi:hypothetical protein